MAASSVSLKEYLKKYQSGSEDQAKKKKKKKKEKPNPRFAGTGVLVVDEDPVWQKPVLEESDDEEQADDTPQVDEDIEVKRMKRLEAIRLRKPYHAIDEDGSGWVPVSEQPKGKDEDLSPPRERRARFDTPSPGREHGEEDTDKPDLSPPRKRREGTSAISPPRRNEGDLSPPRKRRQKADTPSPENDLSPPRRGRGRSMENSGDGDLSPPRRSSMGPPKDLSPPRRRGDADLSPPRRRKEASVTKEVDMSPPRRKKEVRKTGLITGEEMRKEIENTRKQATSRFAAMDASLSGKGAEPVFRDKQGKRISKEEILQKKEEEKPKEKKLEWGKGLAQKREAEAKAQELELEKEKPFARTRDDPDLDKMLKERVRWGDPMAHLVKKNPEAYFEDLGDDEKMKASGFVVPQTIPSHSWIKRGIESIPNRYGIRPGRHWDGVDRSNGYEKELFKRQSDKRATEVEAYLWSVSDM